MSNWRMRPRRVAKLAIWALKGRGCSSVAGSKVAERLQNRGGKVAGLSWSYLPTPSMNKTNSNHLELLTKQGVARLLTVCPRTVENLMAARRLAYIRIGRAVRFERSEIERFKASLTVQAVG